MEVEIKEAEYTYPRLMMKGSQLVVLFEGPKAGTVLVEGFRWKVGEYSAQWKIEDFVNFTHEITLRN